MRILGRTCVAAILSMALAVSVLAGTIHSPGAVSQPPSSDTFVSTIKTTVILTFVGLIR